MRVYPIGETYVDDNPRNKQFINCYNVGTEGCPKVLDDLVNQLPFNEMVECYKESMSKVDVKRGNFQQNFGHASSQCTEKKTPANIARDFGASIPSLLTGTFNPHVQRAVRTLVSIGKFIGVSWLDEESLSLDIMDR